MNDLQNLSNYEEVAEKMKKQIISHMQEGSTQDEAEQYVYMILKGEGFVYSRKVDTIVVPTNKWTETDWELNRINGAIPMYPVYKEYVIFHEVD